LASVEQAIEKDANLKSIEFEYVKLNRVLPLLEEINSGIHEHSMMMESYIHAIRNKAGLREGIENDRLEVDKKIIQNLSQLGIYLPEEFRRLLNTIRCVVSCSWVEPVKMSRVLSSTGGKVHILKASSELQKVLIACFYDMCSSYLRASNEVIDYASLLKAHNLDERAEPILNDSVSKLAWMFILMPEYYSDSDIVIEQEAVEKKYKDGFSEDA